MTNTKELLALALAATPGPWQPMNDRDWDVLIGDIDGPDDGEMHYAAVAEIIDGSPRSRANAALIVAAVNALPALCAEVEAKDERIAQQDATIARLHHALEELMDAASDFRQPRQERDYHRAAWRDARAALTQGEV